MKKSKRFVLPLIVVLALSVISITAFAASAYSSPAEAVAALTGRSVEDVTAQKIETGSTYGSIAADAGKLEEFKASMLERKKEILDARVAAGTLTQERADEILAAMEENMADCDGTGAGRGGAGAGAGAGFGFGKGDGSCGGSCGGSYGGGRGGQGYGAGNGGGRGSCGGTGSGAPQG